MNENQIHAFRIVAFCGGFSRASWILGVTQSTVTKRIAALEEELGVILFERPTRNKKMKLTPAGQELLGPAQQIQKGFDGARAAIRSYKEEAP